MATPATARNVTPMPPRPVRPPRPTADPAPRPYKPAKQTNIHVNKVGVFPEMPGLPPLSFNVTKVVNNGGGNGGTGTKSIPGADFTSNEDIRAFSNHLRKEARNKAVERSLDAEQLEAILRNIPDQHGTMAGSRARARRVSRHLKRIAAAEKLIAKLATGLYSSFEREFDAELTKIGRGRVQPQPRTPFSWQR